MQRVDLFGPFAVGKTYVTRQLFKDRTIKNSWISFDVFKEKTYKAMAIKNVNGFKKALFSIPLQINYPKRLILPLSLKILGYNLELYLLKEKHKDWSLFLENCITGIYLNKKYEIKKLQGACSLLHSCAKVNLANIYGDGHNIVFDESLSQGIYDVVEHLSTFQEKTVVRYFETMPPPDTLIYFKDEPQRIFERLMNRFRPRAKYSYSYKTKSEKLHMENVTSQCRIAEIAVKTMKHRGTNVLEVDMSKPLSNSINTLVNALKEFALKQQCYST